MRELVKKESKKESDWERDRVKKGNFLPEIQPAPPVSIHRTKIEISVLFSI